LAFFRDTRALWREFRRPILVFIAAIFVGGFIYGELYALARGERIAFFNLPYIMVQLMALQGIPEERLPSEPYLSIFWYLMPALGFYVVGRGLVDFVRVFFDRGARRRAWETALAAEFRDHIIVIGVGHVGLRVIRALRDMGFDVIAVDTKPPAERLAELRALKTPLIQGDATVSETLIEAGIRHANAIAICTSNDYINVSVAMRARDLNADVRLIVRMWDSRFADQLKRFVGVERVLSASELAAPAFAGAAFGVEIAQTLHIRDESYTVFRLQVAHGSFMEGETIDRLQSEHDFDIVLVERETRVDVHPAGNVVIKAGDTVVIFARHTQILGIVEANRRNGG
jgi:Trk K+ transport system NAD-binding subunit